MLATIILAIIVAIAIVIFAVKAANIKNAIENIYAKQAILHEKYCNHEYRIDGNYKSLAELNRRQDEWLRQHNEMIRELDLIDVWFRRQETRDAKQTTQANREHFAELRKTMSVRDAAKELWVSYTTAKRYEKWRKAQEQ